MSLDESKPTAAPCLIGIDWGTSSFRAYLMKAQGELLDTLVAPEGIMQVPDRDFAGVFYRLLEPWINSYSVPVVASGMITSRNGWLETPYLNVPSGTEQLADAITPIKVQEPAHGNSVLHLITGLKTHNNNVPDVLRGEETQIVGAMQAGIQDGTFVMPGTHSKWVNVQGGLIKEFATYMSGEVYSALCGHTILGTLMSDGAFNEEGFRQGVAVGLDADAKLLHTLFSVRTLPLFGKIAEDAVADYLSGMLIGAELHGALLNRATDNPIIIVGQGDLAERYAIAIKVLGLKSALAADNIAAHGHFAIATSAGLIK